MAGKANSEMEVLPTTGLNWLIGLQAMTGYTRIIFPEMKGQQRALYQSGADRVTDFSSRVGMWELRRYRQFASLLW